MWPSLFGNLVEKSVKRDDVIDRGTDGRGCVVIYKNEADAKRRDDYLGTAGNFMVLAGSQTANGVYSVFTPRYMTSPSRAG